MWNDKITYTFWIEFVKTTNGIAESIKVHDLDKHRYPIMIGYGLLLKVSKHYKIHTPARADKTYLDAAGISLFFFYEPSGKVYTKAKSMKDCLTGSLS